VIAAGIDFLGEGDEEAETGRIRDFRRGITRYPVPGAKVYPLSAADMKQVFAADERPHIEIGTIYPTEDIRGALFIDAFLGKHFAILGSTGTGKSTATALILHRICERAPEGHIMMIDPHGEYSAAFKGHGRLFSTSITSPCPMADELRGALRGVRHLVGAERQRERTSSPSACSRARQEPSAKGIKLTVDSPSLLCPTLQLHHRRDGADGQGADTRPICAQDQDRRAQGRPALRFMFPACCRRLDGLVRLQLFRLPAGGRSRSSTCRASRPDIVSVVVAVLSRMVFDYAIWSRGEAQRPILLVCEEAHRYIPADRRDRGQAVRKVLERIAKEGRKYGVSLGLVTQRPSDLAEGVLSQCGTIVAMRLNNDRDQAYVKSAMPEGARGFLDSIPALRNREAIVCGEGVAIPDPGAARRSGGRRSARHRTTRCSRRCGVSRAARSRSSTASSAGGGARAAKAPPLKSSPASPGSRPPAADARASGEAQRLDLASGGGQRAQRRSRTTSASVAVGRRSARRCRAGTPPRRNGARSKPDWHRPVEAVAIGQIFGPLAVAAQVSPRDLDLDDGDLALARRSPSGRRGGCCRAAPRTAPSVLPEEQPRHATRDSRVRPAVRRRNRRGQ
jgi:hypothetical protein